MVAEIALGVGKRERLSIPMSGGTMPNQRQKNAKRSIGSVTSNAMILLEDSMSIYTEEAERKMKQTPCHVDEYGLPFDCRHLHEATQNGRETLAPRIVVECWTCGPRYSVEHVPAERFGHCKLNGHDVRERKGE